MREAINAASLIDIASVDVDKNLPQCEREADFKRQIIDIENYTCEGFTIHAIYSGNGDKIEDCLMGMKA